MSNLLKLIPLPEERPSRRMTIKGQLQSRPLSQANQEALLLLGPQLQKVSDPHGQCLREARVKQGRNPAELATQACISLAQLYELESGTTALFYTQDFATQAKRRVAQLLGEDWDAIAAGPGCSAHAAGSNVLALTPGATATTSPQPVIAVSTDDITVPRLISASADCAVEPVKIQETIAAPQPHTTAPQKQADQGQSTWWWVLVLALIAGAGTQWPALSQMLSTL